MITPASPTRLFTTFHVAERVPSANNRLPVPIVTGCVQTCMRSTSCSRSSVWIRVPLPQTIMSGPSAVLEPAGRVLLRSTRRLHDTVQRDEGRRDDLPHIRFLRE